jgi:hypothetical protein
MLDIVGLTLYFAGFINGGWPFMHAHPEVSAFLFGGLSVPLAVLFVISVGQRLFLLHRKHVHDQWMYEQQQEMLLEQQRSLPLSSLTPVENDGDVLRLSNQSTSSRTQPGHVQTSKGVPPGQDKKVDSDNVIVARMLVDNPGISIRDLAKRTGIPRSSIGATPAWQNRNR